MRTRALSSHRSGCKNAISDWAREGTLTHLRRISWLRVGLIALVAIVASVSVALSKDSVARKPVGSPAALPDINGPGHVLTAGNLFMKVTNNGILGNPFTNLSSDPSGQW